MQDRLIEIARQELAGEKRHPARERGYTFHHGLRTARLSLWLAEELGGDVGQPMDVLFAAGLLHDVGKGEPDHHLVGARRAEKLLSGVMPSEQVAAACEIIAAHCLRDLPNEHPAATRIIQDADILDHHGAQHVWLAIYWNAHHGEPVDELARYHFDEENQRWVNGSCASLNFDVAREEFDRRRAFQEQFFNQFRQELMGPWPGA